MTTYTCIAIHLLAGGRTTYIMKPDDGGATRVMELGRGGLDPKRAYTKEELDQLDHERIVTLK